MTNVVRLIVRVIYILSGLSEDELCRSKWLYISTTNTPSCNFAFDEEQDGSEKKGGWHKVRRTYALYNRVRESGVEEEVA